jgi:hypothetical protein
LIASLLNGLIQPFQQPERVVGFFNTYRQVHPVSRQILRGVGEQFQWWLKDWSEKRNIPVLEPPEGRRVDFVAPYFKRARPDAVVVVLKAREPARILIAVGNSKANRWHLQIANRWVTQYNFYINDQRWDGCSSAFVPTFRSRLESVSINITGSPTGCARRASPSNNAQMPSSGVLRLSASSSSLMR